MKTPNISHLTGIARSKTSAYELHELMCMHGELLQVLLNRYKHLEDTNQWKKLVRESLAEYDKMQVQYDKMQEGDY